MWRSFARNTVVTNGTVPLVDLGPGPRALYVVSLDGPPTINDPIRGAGVFELAAGNARRSHPTP